MFYLAILFNFYFKIFKITIKHKKKLFNLKLKALRKKHLIERLQI